MSRIAAIDPAAAAPKAQAILVAVQKSLGMTPNLFRVAAQAPAALEGMVQLSGALAHGRFDARTRESIALAVAEANGCDYCLSAHTALGHGAGLGDAEIAAARAGGATDARTAALVHFARNLVQNRGHVGDAELARLRQNGLSDADIIEAVATVVANIFTNYLNHVAETDIDFPVVHAGLAVPA